MKIVLLGIGQVLRGDDGIGPVSVQWWSKEYQETAKNPSLRVILAQTPGLEILTLLEDSDAAIFVDAMQIGVPAGQIRVFNPLPASFHATPAGKTAHGFGIVETIALARQLPHPLPEHLILIGVEGVNFDIGRSLSDAVQSEIPAVALEIQRNILALLAS